MKVPAGSDAPPAAQLDAGVLLSAVGLTGAGAPDSSVPRRCVVPRPRAQRVPLLLQVSRVSEPGFGSCFRVSSRVRSLFAASSFVDVASC